MFHEIHDLFGIDFRNELFIDFWWKMAPTMVWRIDWRIAPGAPFSRPFPKVDVLMHFGRPLAHFWLPFGSLLAPLGSLLAPVGSLLAPFGSLLAPFRLHFCHFNWLWIPFGSIWLPFAYFFLFLTPSPNPSAKNREINTCIQPPADFRIHLSLQARGG